MNILKVEDIKKTYTSRMGTNRVDALKGVFFSVEEGEYVAIMGESGSSKTTLLNILAAIDKASSGSVILAGNNVSTIKESEMATFRRDNLGYVFQDFNLLDSLSLEDNIFLPLVLIVQGRDFWNICCLFSIMALSCCIFTSNIREI